MVLRVGQNDPNASVVDLHVSYLGSLPPARAVAVEITSASGECATNKAEEASEEP